VLVEEKKLSEEEEVSDERPEGQGQNYDDKTTTDKPIEQADLQEDNPKP
jgi:hypothetical protein